MVKASLRSSTTWLVVLLCVACAAAKDYALAGLSATIEELKSSPEYISTPECELALAAQAGDVETMTVLLDGDAGLLDLKCLKVHRLRLAVR
jgi:hypothetical protein